MKNYLYVLGFLVVFTFTGSITHAQTVVSPIFQDDISGDAGVTRNLSGTGGSVVTSVNPFTDASGSYINSLIATGTPGRPTIVAYTPSSATSSWAALAGTVSVGGINYTALNGAFDVFVRPNTIPANTAWFRPVDVTQISGSSGMRIIFNGDEISDIQAQVVTGSGNGLGSVPGVFTANSTWALPGAITHATSSVLKRGSTSHMGITFNTDPATGRVTMRIFGVLGTGAIDTASNANLLATQSFYISANAVGPNALPTGTWKIVENPSSTVNTDVSYDTIRLYKNDPGVFPALPTVSATFGAKLRRLAAGAAISNPLTNVPLRPAPAWLPNTAYQIGEVVQNGLNLYMCYRGGTSASTGGPTGTGYTNIADGTTLWIYYGSPVATTTDPLAPVITSTISAATLTSMGLTNYYNPVTGPSSFLFGGGVPTPASGTPGSQVVFPSVHSNTSNLSGNVGLNNGYNNLNWSTTFVTDAPKIAIGVAFANIPVNITIDGRRLLPGGYQGVGGANPGWFILDFTNAGGRKQRTIMIEDQPNIPFAGVKVDASSTISAATTTDRIRAAFFGSSIEGGGNGFPIMPQLSWPVQVSRMLGWSDPWNLGIGGTGYLNSRSGVSFTYLGHITDATSISPDIVVVGGPVNDQSLYSTTTIKNAAVTLFQQLRSSLPNVPIVLMGSYPAATGPSASMTASEAAIATAVQEVHDPLAFFVPIISGPGGSLITGTGRVTAPAGNGNSDIYTSSDGVHPVQAGIDYQAVQYAARIKSIVVDLLN